MSNAIIKEKHNYIAEMLYSKKEKHTAKDNIIYPFWDRADELIAYYNMLCPDWDNKTYFSLLKINGNNKYRWSINRADFINLDVEKETDFYCSVNTFYAIGKQTSSYSKNLNAIIVDLDYYNIPHLKNLEPWQVAELLKRDVDYPTESFYTESGRGICLFWLLEKTYSTKKSRSFYKKIVETLIDKFKDFGADPKCKDIARVVRIPGSINSKSGNRVKIVTPKYTDIEEYYLNPQRYELSELAEYFWGEYIPKEKPKNIKVKKEKKINNITTLKTVKNLHYTRCKDIETLINIRQDKPQDGIREHLLFIYRLQLLLGGTEPQKALELTLSLNNKLIDPLDKKEVMKATESAVGNAQTYFRLKDKYKAEYGTLNNYLSNGGVYLYSNKTIIELLKITESEMEHLENLINIKEKNNRKRAKYQKNKNTINQIRKEKYDSDKRKSNYKDKLKEQGKMGRDERNAILRQKIKSLLAEGFTQRAIALKLEISLSSTNKHIKSIKENGL